MRKPFKYTPTADERRTVRNWTCGVLLIYGALALAAYGLAGARQHFAGAKDPASSTVGAAAVADRGQPSR
jgi:hypothetical protein